MRTLPNFVHALGALAMTALLITTGCATTGDTQAEPQTCAIAQSDGDADEAAASPHCPDHQDNPDYKYVGESKEICTRIKFACDAGWGFFQDDCGCGCTRDTAESPKPAVVLCGRATDAPCGADQVCDFPTDAPCGAKDTPGHCVPRPEICLEIYLPVCGCDGKDYGNACAGLRSGTDAAKAGHCDGSPVPGPVQK